MGLGDQGEEAENGQDKVAPQWMGDSVNQKMDDSCSNADSVTSF